MRSTRTLLLLASCKICRPFLMCPCRALIVRGAHRVRTIHDAGDPLNWELPLSGNPIPGCAIDALRSQAFDARAASMQSSFVRMSSARQSLGKKGEQIAARWLAIHGWQIAERRFR